VTARDDDTGRPGPEAMFVQPLFALGRLAATPGALDAIARAGASVPHLVVRHCRGDWGDVSTADRAANDRALTDGARLLSAYRLAAGDDAGRVWILTEADRSRTTLLLPDEY